MSSSERTIVDAVEPQLAPLGLLVEDITLVPAGKRRLVRILVDRVVDLDDGATVDEPIAPVTLDEVADATRAISDELDASDVMGEQPYVLEVSSPGTDRPLTLPRHFARNVGRLIVATLEAGEGEDSQKVAGRITAADAERVVITPEQGGKKAGASTTSAPRELNYTSITGAKVQVEFTRGDDADSVGEDV